MLLKQNLIWKINTLIWFYCFEKEEQLNGRQGEDGVYLSETEMAHPTSEFILVL